MAKAKRINLGDLQDKLDTAARAVDNTRAAMIEADHQYMDALEEHARARAALCLAAAQVASI